MSLSISVIIRPEVRRVVWPSTIKRRIERIFSHPLITEKIPPVATLCITLTNDAEIHRLNRDYRGKDQSTDVLSFAMEEGEDWIVPPEAERDLGDVIISIETARKQAEQGMLPRLREVVGDREWGLSEEVYFLMLHGLLHLLGYDHIEDADALEMEALEAALLPSLFAWKSAS